MVHSSALGSHSERSVLWRVLSAPSRNVFVGSRRLIVADLRAPQPSEASGTPRMMMGSFQARCINERIEGAMFYGGASNTVVSRIRGCCFPLDHILPGIQMQLSLLYRLLGYFVNLMLAFGKIGPISLKGRSCFARRHAMNETLKCAPFRESNG